MALSKSVDVAISVYGKPYQTAVTLLSLLRYSEQWIDTIYILEDPKQPFGADLRIVHELLAGYKTVRYVPRYFMGYFNIMKSYKRHLLSIPLFRRAVRYQYAWEKSDKSYLLLTHNDMLYTGDLVEAYLENIGDAVGIGKVGQCWNCPAYKANLCDPDRYEQYRPDFSEVSRLYEQYDNVRPTPFTDSVTPQHPWPLPECRLNEFSALINLSIARPVTMPYGPAYPIGVMNSVDTGAQWFRQVTQMGLRVKHFESDPYTRHGWASDFHSGNQALSNRASYELEEKRAYEKLCSEYALQDPIVG